MPTHIPLKTALPTAVAVCVMLALFAVQAGLTLRPAGVPHFGVQYPHLAYGYQSSVASSSADSSSSSSAPACSFTDGFEDQTLAPFTTSGDAAWTVGNVAFAGSFGALSGVIGSEEETVLRLTQTVETGGATLSFRVKVSSEATFDTLTFIVNGVEEETYSGEVDWTLFSMALPAGEHTLVWKYAKDADGVSGDDSAWIDAVSISNTVCGSCGDEVLNAGETCDDGGDGALCDNDCTEPLCGDGHRNTAAGEACDDGDTDSGDGCSAQCTVETGFSCVGTDPDSCSATCGDGVKASSEACDDGNVVLGDGCSTSCTVESGFNCTGTSPSMCGAVCGDGIVAGDETCDDGDTDSGDGCNASCQEEDGYNCTGAPSACDAVCGDGVLVDGVESCDDGDTDSGDGCSSSCAVESGFVCIGSAPSTCSADCGDGALASTEECDDGDIASGDGCSDSCDIEEGFSCSGDPSACVGVCGDGQRVAGEECDDGNAVSGDGCSAACQEESGYNCTGTPSSCTAVCGDGVLVDGVESCDDGDTDSGDGCSAACQEEAGFTCSGEPSSCTGICGDGLQVAGEECDDGNQSNTDACLNSCQLATCGDTFVRTGVEECEPPGFGTCSMSCTEQVGIGGSTDRVPESTVIIRNTLQLRSDPLCGNGVVDPGEECDPSARGVGGADPNCSQTCTRNFCGDGIVQAGRGEECEPLQNADGDFIIPLCGSACTYPLCDDDGANCSGGCRLVVRRSCTAALPLEEQNAASSPRSLPSASDVPVTNSNPVTGASAARSPLAPAAPSVPNTASSATAVRLPSGASSLSLRFTPDPPPSLLPMSTSSRSFSGGSSSARSALPAAAFCGNGKREGAEECDDGSANADDTPDACRTDCTLPRCGDGVTDTAELCDDGNTFNGDGCTSVCTAAVCGNGFLEAGEECDDGERAARRFSLRFNADEPGFCRTNCMVPRCGDGITDGTFGEECDDGENNSMTDPDRCRTNCLLPRCGDGIADTGEECDDGNADDGDACGNDCRLSVCGDGAVDAAEECDDGNTLSGDGCSERCQEERPAAPEEERGFLAFLRRVVRVFVRPFR